MPIARTGLGIAGRVLKWGFGHIPGIVKSLTTPGSLKNPRVMADIAKKSLATYGKVSLLTYGARMASGRSPFKSGSGKRNIFPFTPV